MSVPAQVTLESTPVLQHLLFHKATLDLDEDPQRINNLLSLLEEDEGGEYVSMRDPFQRDVAMALQLVIQEHLDPWDLDLGQFSQLFLDRARKEGMDLTTAGRILLMAWHVLRLQCDEALTRALEFEPEEEDLDAGFDWEDFDAIEGWEDEDYQYTQEVITRPDDLLDEKIRHKGDRPVTLMELIGALEDVHTESRERENRLAKQAEARVKLKAQLRGKVGAMMHTEDLEAEVAETYARIMDYGQGRVPFSGIVGDNAVDLVQTFTSVLFLVKRSKLRVDQPDFPRGEIWIERIGELDDVVAEESVEVEA